MYRIRTMSLNCLKEHTERICGMFGHMRTVHTVMCFMALLPDTLNCGLRMSRGCRERFPRHRFQRKPLVSDPGMHHGTCVTHVPWCMSGIANLRWRGKRSRHSRRMRNPQFTYLVRGPLCFDTGRFYQYPSGLLQCQSDNHGDCSIQP